MDNQAIANITLAIRNILKDALGNDYQVSLYSPWEDFGDAKGANLFLYKVEENAHWKNMDWQGDRSNPKKELHSPLSLDLYYLLTPYAPKVGDSVRDIAEKQRLLGCSMQALHTNPVLNNCPDSIFNEDLDNGFLQDLKDGYEKIKITCTPINLEEMSKIWSMGDKPYRLSVAYHVSLVQIEPMIPSKAIAPPIQETALKISTPKVPAIADLQPSMGAVGTELHIIGQNLILQGFKTEIKFGEFILKDFEPIAEGEISITVPEDTRRGPRQNVSVVLNDQESNSLKFEIHPWIAKIKPLRGAIESGNNAQPFPIEIHGAGFKGSVNLKIGNKQVNADDIHVMNENLINTIVPRSLENGFHQVDLSFDENPANKLTFEVVPLIKRIQPNRGEIGEAILIKGKRFKDKNDPDHKPDVRIRIGPAIIIQENNENPTQLTFKVPKTLNPGVHQVSVTVDGHESNTMTFEVTE